MTFVSPELKEGVQKLLDRLNSPEDPAASMGQTVATAKMTGPQTSVAKWPNWTVTSDEPRSVGGNDTAPPPSSIFVAAIGFAENVIFARQAALNGLDFTSMETKVEATWDMRGLFGIRNADPSITNLLIETKVVTDAPGEKVAEVLRLNDQRCPMTTTVAKSAKVRRKLYINGMESPI